MGWLAQEFVLMEIKFVYYSAEWREPCQMYYPEVLAWAMELNANVTKVDLSGGFMGDIKSVPMMGVIVDGKLKLRTVRWGPGTREQILGVLS